MREPEIRPQDERISLTQLLEKLDKLNLNLKKDSVLNVTFRIESY
jgi:hypothetical protein